MLPGNVSRSSKNMASSKVVSTCHHICRFLHRSLVLKTHPNAGQMPITMAKEKKKKYG